MNSMAALMVIVACHPQDATCLQEPVAVISYQSDEACFGALGTELERARKMAKLVYGDCVPVSPELVAGRDIRQDIDPAKLAALDVMVPPAAPVTAQAMVPPVPLERFQDVR